MSCASMLVRSSGVPYRARSSFVTTTVAKCWRLSGPSFPAGPFGVLGFLGTWVVSDSQYLTFLADHHAYGSIVWTDST